MRYLIHVWGKGGCDYTMSCNETVFLLDAENMEDAKKEAENVVYDDRIEKAMIIECSQEWEVPVAKWKTAFAQKQKEEYEKRYLLEKKRQLAQLKYELEGTPIPEEEPEESEEEDGNDYGTVSYLDQCENKYR